MTTIESTTSFCVKRLKALAEPRRLSIIKILMDGPKRVWELNGVLDIEQSLLSHHLKILRKECLVKATRDGKANLYSLTQEVKKSHNAINIGCCQISFD